MAFSRKIEPARCAVVQPLSEVKTLDERIASPVEELSNGAASDTTKHPFKEKGPWRQGCETVLASSLLPSLVLVLLFFGGIAALTVVGVLDDPAIHGSAVIVGYVSFEVLTVRVARMSYVQRFLQPISSTAVSCVLMHAVFTWCAVATLRSPPRNPGHHRFPSPHSLSLPETRTRDLAISQDPLPPPDPTPPLSSLPSPLDS